MVTVVVLAIFLSILMPMFIVSIIDITISPNLHLIMKVRVVGPQNLTSSTHHKLEDNCISCQTVTNLDMTFNNLSLWFSSKEHIEGALYAIKIDYKVSMEQAHLWIT